MWEPQPLATLRASTACTCITLPIYCNNFKWTLSLNLGKRSKGPTDRKAELASDTLGTWIPATLAGNQTQTIRSVARHLTGWVSCHSSTFLFCTFTESYAFLHDRVNIWLEKIASIIRLYDWLIDSLMGLKSIHTEDNLRKTDDS
jgi:hypothetical protein